MGSFHACASRHVCSYEEQLSLVKLRQVLEERLEDYNMEPKLVSMQLVLFKVRQRTVAYQAREVTSAWAGLTHAYL